MTEGQDLPRVRHDKQTCERHLVTKGSMQPAALPFRGAPVCRRSPRRLPFLRCGVWHWCPSLGILHLPLPSPWLVTPVSHPPFIEASLLLSIYAKQPHPGDATPGLGNGGAASWQDALCQSLLLRLSVCGDSSCHELQMGAVGASGVSCVCSPWRRAPDLMSVLHPFLLLVHLGMMAFGPHLSLRTQGLILALPTLRSQTLSCVTWGGI